MNMNPHIRHTFRKLIATALILTTLFAGTQAHAQMPTGEITVYAAASLRDAFTAIGRDFEAKYPDTRVAFSFAGSQQLAEQIGYGAPADVFASANEKLMKAVVKTTRIDAAQAHRFAHNQLVVVYPKSNPARLRKLNDLAKKGVTLVLANKAVPAGGYALDFLNKAAAKPEFGLLYRTAVLSNIVSYEEDVRTVFAKIVLGEADAGIVYAIDVLADKAKAVRTITIPVELNTVAVYPIAPLVDSPNPALAHAFVDYVLSPAGQATLKRYGFAIP